MNRQVLSAQSAKLIAQANAISRLMSQLGTVKRGANGPRMVPSYSGAVGEQSGQSQAPAVGQQYVHVMCGVLHMKRECPQLLGTHNLRKDKPFKET